MAPGVRVGVGLGEEQDLPCFTRYHQRPPAEDFDAVKRLFLKTKQTLPWIGCERELGLSVEVRALHNQLEGVGEEVNEVFFGWLN